MNIKYIVLAFLINIFPWKILCIGRNHVIQVEIWRNFAKKKTLVQGNARGPHAILFFFHVFLVIPRGRPLVLYTESSLNRLWNHQLPSGMRPSRSIALLWNAIHLNRLNVFQAGMVLFYSTKYYRSYIFHRRTILFILQNRFPLRFLSDPLCWQNLARASGSAILLTYYLVLFMGNILRTHWGENK